MRDSRSIIENVLHLLQDLVVKKQKSFSNGLIKNWEPILKGNAQQMELTVKTHDNQLFQTKAEHKGKHTVNANMAIDFYGISSELKLLKNRNTLFLHMYNLELYQSLCFVLIIYISLLI